MPRGGGLPDKIFEKHQLDYYRTGREPAWHLRGGRRPIVKWGGRIVKSANLTIRNPHKERPIVRLESRFPNPLNINSLKKRDSNLTIGVSLWELRIVRLADFTIRLPHFTIG